jgi:hypothetical protein
VPIVDRATGKLAGLVARSDVLRVRAHAAQLERERGRVMGMSWLQRRAPRKRSQVTLDANGDLD